MAAGITENGDEKIGRAIDDKVLLGEFRRGRDKALNLDHTLDAGEIADGSLCLSQKVDGAKFGGSTGAGHIHIPADKAGDGKLAVCHRQLPGQVKKIAGQYIGNIIGGGSRCHGQDNPKFFEPAFDGIHVLLSRFC